MFGSGFWQVVGHQVLPGGDQVLPDGDQVFPDGCQVLPDVFWQFWKKGFCIVGMV